MRNVIVHIFFPLNGRHGRVRVALSTFSLALAMTLGGCASVPPPDASMNRAQQLLQDARDAGAADYAPVDLGFAQDKFQQAQTAMSDRKYGDAANLAEESRADAELAQAKARLGAARAQIQAKVKENARLRRVGEQIDAAPQQETSPEDAGQAPTIPAGELPAPPASVLSAPMPQGAGFQTVPAGSSSAPTVRDDPSQGHPDPDSQPQGGQS